MKETGKNWNDVVTVYLQISRNKLITHTICREVNCYEAVAPIPADDKTFESAVCEPEVPETRFIV